MADPIELYLNTDNDITINLVGITTITSMSVLLIRKNDNFIHTVTSGSGKITFSVVGDVTTANMRIDKTLLLSKGIYLISMTVVVGGSTRALKPNPTFLTVV